MHNRGTIAHVILVLAILSAVMVPVTGLSGPASAHVVPSPSHSVPTEFRSARFPRAHPSLRQHITRFFRFFRNLGRSVKEIEVSQVWKLVAQTTGDPVILTDARASRKASKFYLIYLSPKVAGAVTSPRTALMQTSTPGGPTAFLTISDITREGAWKKVEDELSRLPRLYVIRNPSAIFRLTPQPVSVRLSLTKAANGVATASVGAAITIGDRVRLRKTSRNELTLEDLIQDSTTKIPLPSSGLFTRLNDVHGHVAESLQRLSDRLQGLSHPDGTYDVLVRPPSITVSQYHQFLEYEHSYRKDLFWRRIFKPAYLPELPEIARRAPGDGWVTLLTSPSPREAKYAYSMHRTTSTVGRNAKRQNITEVWIVGPNSREVTVTPATDWVRWEEAAGVFGWSTTTPLYYTYEQIPEVKTSSRTRSDGRTVFTTTINVTPEVPAVTAPQ